MFENKTRLAMLVVLLLALILVVAFSIRAANHGTPTPTISLAEVQTAAVATFGSDLTRTAEAIPTVTSTGTPIPTPAATNTEAISPTPSCYRLKFIKDVTVPDYSVMTSGESFTKTWLVENSGTCAWRAGFIFDLIGGDGMSGLPLTLTQTVEPGGRMELSILMTAPLDQAGIVTGTWRMSDENGNYFGDALTVTINLGVTLATPTP